MRPLIALTALLLGAALAVVSAQSLQPIPKLESRVTDLTGTLTAGQQAELEQKLADFEARKGAQIAVLLVPTTHPEEIEQYSIRVVDAWKLGRKKVDDGALLILAKDDHRLRIENGYGLEGVLTDAASNRIIEETIVPLLRQGQYFAAISAGVDQMMRLIDGEPLPPPDQTWQHRQGSHGAHNLNYLPFLLFGLLFLSSILRAIFGQTAGAALSAGGVGVVAFLLTQLVSFAIGAAVVGFFVALFLGAAGGGWSSGGGRFGGPFGGIGGFGGGLGGGFGGGGGGFGGGGGGFGGGGASGSW